MRTDRGTLEDITSDFYERAKGDIIAQQNALLEDIISLDAKGEPLSLDGDKNGLYKRRDELSPLLQDLGRDKLQSVAKTLLEDGKIEKVTDTDNKRFKYLKATQIDDDND